MSAGSRGLVSIAGGTPGLRVSTPSSDSALAKRLLEAAYVQSAYRTTESDPRSPTSAASRGLRHGSALSIERQLRGMRSSQQSQVRSSWNSGRGLLAVESSESPVPDLQVVAGDDGSPGAVATPLMSATRAPGLAGQLARAQALLRDCAADKRRLEAELCAAQELAASAEAAAVAGLEAERQRYRREVEFVRAGVDAAAAQRDAAASRRKESHERALRRAVREAEERERALAREAAEERETAHRRALDDQASHFEHQRAIYQQHVVDLALEVRDLQCGGMWPDGATLDAKCVSDVQIDGETAYRVLCDAVATAAHAMGAPTSTSASIRERGRSRPPQK